MTGPLDAWFGNWLSKGYKSIGSYYDVSYQTRYKGDIERFWSDYYKNTGFKPRYPYKTGAVYNDAIYWNALARQSQYAYQLGHFWK